MRHGLWRDRRSRRLGRRQPSWRGVGLARASPPWWVCCEASARPFRARRAVPPCRAGSWKPDPRGQEDITLLCLERAPSRKAALPRISRERGGLVRARARGPKRATSDKALPYRSDPLGSGERKWRNPARGLPPPPSFRCGCFCRPRAGRDVRGPTCPRGSPEATSRRGSRPASKAPGRRAGFRPGRSSSAKPAPSVKPGARRRAGAGRAVS
jgi:hypothetical protein